MPDMISSTEMPISVPNLRRFARFLKLCLFPTNLRFYQKMISLYLVFVGKWKETENDVLLSNVIILFHGHHDSNRL